MSGVLEGPGLQDFPTLQASSSELQTKATRRSAKLTRPAIEVGRLQAKQASSQKDSKWRATSVMQVLPNRTLQPGIGYPGQPGNPEVPHFAQPLHVPVSVPFHMFPSPPLSIASSPLSDSPKSAGNGAANHFQVTPQMYHPQNFQQPMYIPPNAFSHPIIFHDPANDIHPSWHSITAPEWVPHHPNRLRANVRDQPESITETAQPPDLERDLWEQSSRRSEVVHGEDGEVLPRKLSKFAATFTPDWIKALPPPGQALLLPQLPPQVPPNYASEFLPLPLLQSPYPDISTLPSILSLAPQQGTQGLPTLSEDPQDYASRWNALLSLELDHLQKLARSQMLYRVEIAKVEPTSGSASQPDKKQLWQVSIPGVREDWPRIIIGDTLLLRGLYPSKKLSSWASVEARVTGMIKRDGVVFIESDSLENVDRDLERNFRGKGEWNVAVRASSGPIAVMQNGVRRISAFLQNAHHSSHPLQQENRPLAARWLFPRDEHSDTLRASGQFPATRPTWCDEDLNNAQKSAIELVLAGGSRPICISGPPGTGKTKTLVEAVMQVYWSQPNARILVTAPSNAAADTLARRLAKHLKPNEMLRLQSQVRSFAEVPMEVLPYCFIAGDKFSVPAWEHLIRLRVVVSSCLDTDLLSQARVSNAEIGRLRRHYDAVFPDHTALHWTHLMVDEAGQASEPEVLVAIAVVLPGIDGPVSPTLVLCGDIQQLPPIILSSTARDCELDMSLLERLTWKPHRTPENETHCDGVEYCQLLLNYRSQLGILMIASTLYYNDKLQPAAPISQCTWEGLPNPDIPLALFGIEAEEDWIGEGSSYFNTAEIEKCVELVTSLTAKTGGGGYMPQEIGIITPWREHVWRLRQRLRGVKLSAVNVGHVEAYQGSEWRVVIISCVRSSERFLAKDRRSGSGLTFEHKRLNVALTRAKDLMIIVGNMNTHKVDPAWSSLLHLARRHNLYNGPEVELASDTAGVSRLESKLYAGMRSDDTIDMHADMIAGAMARIGMQD